jgi:hypothetical protein
MTTATETPTPDPAPAPVEPDLTSMFYDPAKPAESPAPDAPPAPVPDHGLVATPEASAPSPETAKPETPPVGSETSEKPKDDKGHAAAARRLGSEVAELKREMQTTIEENRVLKAKLDGTYQEPVQPSVEEVTARAEFKGRETASRAVAEGLYGADTVKTQVYDDDSPYKQLVQAQPWLHARVARHPQPTVEAMRVLKEQEFLTKYGSDPTQWVTKIEAEVRPRIAEEFKTKTITPVTGTKAPSVTEARGSGGLPKERSLEDVFYGKPPVTGGT